MATTELRRPSGSIEEWNWDGEVQRLYKLTDIDGRTRSPMTFPPLTSSATGDRTQWEVGKYCVAGELDHFTSHGFRQLCYLGPSAGIPSLCTATVLHAYRNPLMAEMFDAHQGKYGDIGRLWLVEGPVCVEDGTKTGSPWLRVVKEVRRVPLGSWVQKLVIEYVLDGLRGPISYSSVDGALLDPYRIFVDVCSDARWEDTSRLIRKAVLRCRRENPDGYKESVRTLRRWRRRHRKTILDSRFNMMIG